jgi:LysR family carnitine catabolism transcriptional activator
MEVKLDQLEAFVTIGRLFSFTKAAQVLHISSPALTMRLRQLEATLGVRLLDRNTRMVRPTQVGKELAPLLERILNELAAIVTNTKELSSNKRGVVTIAALPSICATVLPRIIAQFKKRHPGISVVLKDTVTSQIISMVKAEQVDLGIGIINFVDPEVQFTELFVDKMIIVFPPGHPLEKKKTVNLADLVKYQLILTETGVQQLARQAFHFEIPAYEVVFMTTAASMVRGGLGISILPHCATEMGELSGLRYRRFKSPALTRTVGIFEKPKRSRSPAAESFLSTAHEAMKSGAQAETAEIRT